VRALEEGVNMSDQLRELINGAMTELNPEIQDNQPTETDSEALDDSEFEVESSQDDSEEAEDASEATEEESEDEDEDDESSEEADEPSADSGKIHTVKVNGEVLEVVCPSPDNCEHALGVNRSSFPRRRYQFSPSQVVTCY
jgi:ribonuclease E